MKLYDKVYYELDPFFPSFCIRLNTGEKIGIHSGPLICMTIEELSQLWNAGHSAGMEDAGATLKRPAVDFEAYLQSKGINI